MLQQHDTSRSRNSKTQISLFQSDFGHARPRWVGGGGKSARRPGRCLDDGVAGSGGDSAHVLVVASHLDVALRSPCLTPAVLHQPVVLAFVDAIADGQHTVIKTGAAALVVDENSALVVPEIGAGGIDGDGDGSDLLTQIATEEQQHCSLFEDTGGQVKARSHIQ